MTIQKFNTLGNTEMGRLLHKCCGSRTWVENMVSKRPFKDIAHLQNHADRVWQSCNKSDVLEAFSHHPKIGDRESLSKKFADTAEWAKNEQSSVEHAGSEIIKKLEKANLEYLAKFGYIFIVFATGKSASQMLDCLRIRLKNEHKAEFEIARAEQIKITKLRLQKLFE